MMNHVSQRLILAPLVLILTVACNPTPQDGTSDIRIMSYNIKFDDPNDTVNGWEQRKQRVANLITFYEPDFLGTQEGLLNQLQYLDSTLVDMDWIGVGRTDGDTEGEFSALFYNSKRFELVAGTDSTIWLSENPGRPGKSWDAALPRILTWGKFISKQSGEPFFVFNTHFDHIGDTARVESAKLIIDTIHKVAGNQRVILTGDFNVTPDQKPYAILTSSNGLKDTHNLAESRHIGPEFTYSGFTVDPGIAKRRIDYIFINERLTVGKHGAISDFNDGSYPSDHLPVISELKLYNTKATSHE